MSHEQLRDLWPRGIIKKYRIPLIKIPLFVKRAQKEIEKRNNAITLFSDIPELLRALKQRGNIIGIVSSNSKNNIILTLEKYSISDVVDFIVTENSLFGKAPILKKIIRKQKLTPDKVIYVGDEQRDLEAAQKAGIQGIGVTWGYNTKEMLNKPDGDAKLVDTPKELLAIL